MSMPEAPTAVRLVSAHASRAELEEFLRQREALGFRILAISATDEDGEYAPIHPRTMITIIDAAAPPGAPLAVIEYHTPAAPPLAEGAECVCSGRCFVAGSPANVLVYRQAGIGKADTRLPA